MDFKSKTVMVTGAAGNLGRAVAQVFAERGANLMLVGRNPESLERVFGKASGTQSFVTGDLLDAAQVHAMAQRAIDRFGRIDVLANLAGGFRMGSPVHATPPDDWRFLLDINVRTLVNAVQAVVPRMLAQGGGKIVKVGAFSARKGVAQMGAYVASKSAVIRLTETLSAELREQHINVNCVMPGAIDTPENRAAMPGADPSRWVTPRELAEVIAFLASEAARAVHGAAVPVTGLG
jgi:NAD(P)-dependent dehydrogenase (short-subunit alcohol dehydrogenase family)